MKNIQIR